MKLGIRPPSALPTHQITSHVDSVEEDTVQRNAQPMDSSAQNFTSWIIIVRVCRSTQVFSGTSASHCKQVFIVEESELNTSDSECTLVINPIQIDGLEKPSAWISIIATPQCDITLKLDTGAGANILPIATYNKLSLKPPLKPTDVKLTAYGGTSLSPLRTR